MKIKIPLFLFIFFNNPSHLLLNYFDTMGITNQQFSKIAALLFVYI